MSAAYPDRRLLEKAWNVVNVSLSIALKGKSGAEAKLAEIKDLIEKRATYSTSELFIRAEALALVSLLTQFKLPQCIFEGAIQALTEKDPALNRELCKKFAEALIHITIPPSSLTMEDLGTAGKQNNQTLDQETTRINKYMKDITILINEIPTPKTPITMKNKIKEKIDKKGKEEQKESEVRSDLLNTEKVEDTTSISSKVDAMETWKERALGVVTDAHFVKSLVLLARTYEAIKGQQELAPPRMQHNLTEVVTVTAASRAMMLVKVDGSPLLMTDLRTFRVVKEKWTAAQMGIVNSILALAGSPFYFAVMNIGNSGASKATEGMFMFLANNQTKKRKYLGTNGECIIHQVGTNWWFERRDQQLLVVDKNARVVGQVSNERVLKEKRPYYTATATRVEKLKLEERKEALAKEQERKLREKKASAKSESPPPQVMKKT